MESFLILVNADLINSLFEFLNYELSSNDQRKVVAVKTVDIVVPSPAKCVSKYQPPDRMDSSLSLQSTTTSQQSPRPSQPSLENTPETKVELVLKPWKIVLIEDPKNNDSNCLIVTLSANMLLVNHGDSTKISAAIKDLAFYGSNFEQIKHSQIRYSVR